MQTEIERLRKREHYLEGQVIMLLRAAGGSVTFSKADLDRPMGDVCLHGGPDGDGWRLWLTNDT